MAEPGEDMLDATKFNESFCFESRIQIMSFVKQRTLSGATKSQPGNETRPRSVSNADRAAAASTAGEQRRPSGRPLAAAAAR